MRDAAPLPTVLLVEGDQGRLARMRAALSGEHDVVAAETAAAARAAMQEHFVQAVLCGRPGGGEPAAALWAELRRRWPETVRVELDGTAAAEAGADPLALACPSEADAALRASARAAVRLFQLARENERLALELRCAGGSGGGAAKLDARRRGLREGAGFARILRRAGSPMDAVVEEARHLATFDVPVLLSGEPGTGKAALAEAMHMGSLRSDRPFLELDCTGRGAANLEAELCGTRPGPGLPAAASRPGLFQRAGRGTVFLNGVDALTPELQARLLRVLRDGCFHPLGTQEPVTLACRILAGSHAELAAAVAEGRFRRDLYHALAVAEIAVPPLRRRRRDIAFLADHMLFDLAAQHGKPVAAISEAALEFLTAWHWPGNLPELENELTRMLVFGQEKVLGPELVSRRILQGAPEPVGAGTPEALDGHGPLKDRIDAVESRILRETLTRLRWNKSRAAAELGLSRVGLRAKLERHGLHPPARTPEPSRQEG